MKSLQLLMGFLALSLAGCSTAVSPEKSAKLNPAKTGLILATLNRTGLPVDAQYGKIEMMIRPVDRRDTVLKNPVITNAKGMSLIEVPPGRYQIADWYFDGRAETAESGYEFEVLPGQVTYVGHLEVAVRVDKSAKYFAYLPVRPTFEDRYQGTVAAFRAHYPALADWAARDAAPDQFALEPMKVGYFAGNIPPPATSRDYVGIQLVFAPKFP